jgi:hypothetical protein
MATAHAAWRISRNPMALLLPVIWKSWMEIEEAEARDDELPAIKLIAGVPGYAVDQFTRAGQSVARVHLARDAYIRELLGAADVPPRERYQVIGDILFLLEGGRLKRRAIWPVADSLRLPFRPLPGAFKLKNDLAAAMAHTARQATQIDGLRRQFLYPNQR